MNDSPSLTLAGKSYALRWNLAALYRHQSLPSVTAPADTHGHTTVKAVLEILWAALPREARLLAPDPETLAEALGEQGMSLPALGQIANALLESSALNPEKKAVPSS